jgi:MoxR-like ATPase
MPIDTKTLFELTDAALAADYTRVRRAVENAARILASDGDDQSAKKLRALIRKKGVPLRASGFVETLPVDAKSRLPLIEEQPWPTSPIFLDDVGHRVFDDFISDAGHVEELSAQGLASRLCLLLSGPPGTGKSLLAGHVAAQLKMPFYTIRLDSVISSLLGDTAKNIRSLFDFAPARNAVLFLDEMDAIAKLRDDRQELGELKRVVNTVIQGLDSLDDRSVIVAATNHPHLLDPAIWRRFPYKIEMGTPDPDVRKALWQHFLFSDEPVDEAALLAKASDGLSGADIETLAMTALRHAVLEKRQPDLSTVLKALMMPSTRHGRPQRLPLTSDEKRQLARDLHSKFALNGAEIGRLLGVTRQSANAYLKDEVTHGG